MPKLFFEHPFAKTPHCQIDQHLGPEAKSLLTLKTNGILPMRHSTPPKNGYGFTATTARTMGLGRIAPAMKLEMAAEVLRQRDRIASYYSLTNGEKLEGETQSFNRISAAANWSKAKDEA